MFTSSNPTLNKRTLSKVYGRSDIRTTESMTIAGTVDKVLIMLAIAFATALFSWNQSFMGYDQPAMPSIWLGLGGICGLITAIVTIFKPDVAKITAPAYAAFEGLLLGGISALAESRFPGIAFQAILGTFAVFSGMLFIYRTKVIQVTDKFKTGLVACAMGIMGIYLLTFILSFFGMSIPLIHNSGPIGIGFSLVVVVIASLCLILDFDRIEEASRSGAPKHMEWYLAFGLMVTLVWLYIEILHLLMKLRSND